MSISCTKLLVQLSTAHYRFLFAPRHLMVFLVHHLPSVCLQVPIGRTCGAHWRFGAGELSSGEDLSSPGFGSPPTEVWCCDAAHDCTQGGYRRLPRKEVAGHICRTEQGPILCQGLNPVCHHKVETRLMGSRA